MPVTLVTQGTPCDRSTGPITVGCILDNLFRQVGLTPDQFDVTAAIDEVKGFVVANRASVTEIVDLLLRVYQTDLIEVDGKIKAKKRGEAIVATITETDLAAKIGGSGQVLPKVQVKRLDSLNLPASGDITYFSQTKDYDSGHQSAVRSTQVDVDDKLTINTNLVLDDDTARQSISRMLYELWVHRESFTFLLTPRFLYLAPGDPINIPYGGNLLRVRIIAMDVSLFGPIPIEAVLDEIGVLTQEATGVPMPENPPLSGTAEDTTLIAFSMNALRDADADTVGFYVVVNGASTGEWPGAVLYLSRDGGATYQPFGDLTDGGTYGVATNTLAAPSPETTGLWDRVNFIDVTITNGDPPASVSEAEVLNGENNVLVGAEVVQYATVTPLGGDDYRLSDLLRGKRGTDPFWGTHGASEQVVFLENGGATFRIEADETLVNKTVKLKAVTVGQLVADAASQDLLITGDEFKPYRGCDLRGDRDMSSNLTITWKRRTRKGGAWSDFVDADLVDTPEAYEIDVYNGLSVVRTISVSAETASYSAADQTTDFGSPQSAIDVKVYQIGRYGRGYALEGTI
jgi:hypothetical protein